MYYIIEKTTIEDDFNKCERILSDYFSAELIQILNGKIGNIHFRNLYVPEENDFNISVVKTGENKYWQIR